MSLRRNHKNGDTVFKVAAIWKLQVLKFDVESPRKVIDTHESHAFCQEWMYVHVI